MRVIDPLTTSMPQLSASAPDESCSHSQPEMVKWLMHKLYKLPLKIE